MSLFFHVALGGSSLVLAEELSVHSLDPLRKGVREHVLSNGLKVLFYRRAEAPIFSGIAAVRVGGVNEAVGKTGASHLFEHMAFKGSPVIGTKDYSKEVTLLRELEKLESKRQRGALSERDNAEIARVRSELDAIWDVQEFTRLYRRWGAEGMNATTAKELTNYFASFPKTAFEFWCWAQSERLTRPVMRQFYKERDVVLEERRTRYENEPSGKLYEELLSHAFTVHPYRNPVIGYEEDVSQLTPDDVRDLHDKYYVASNIVIAVVGDLDFDKALPIIERYFSRIPSGRRPTPPRDVEPEQNEERVFSVDFDASPVFFMGYKKPIFPDKAEPALSVFLEYILGSRVAPLYRELVIEKKMTSSLGFFEAPGDSYPNLAVFYGEPIAPYTNDQVIAAFDEGIERLLETPISNRELKIVKRTVLKAALMGMQSNMGLADELAENEQKFGTWQASLQWYEQLLSLTTEDVMNAARKYLQRSGRTVGLLSRGAKEAQVTKAQDSLVASQALLVAPQASLVAPQG
ncbi:MAG: insulinase family protein [Bdellovibrionales bacterium]|nr:insulinase family protein [Bdellovibrionales bacterium]